jgi:signal transduction histidine kinase
MPMAARLVGRYSAWPDAPAGPFWVARTKQVVVPKDGDSRRLALSLDREHLDTIRELNLVAWLCLPLVFRDEVFGVMTVARNEGPFPTLQVAFARTLAHRIGQAVAHGRMYEEVQTASRRKDEFLAMLGHELRNPLGALSNAISALQSGRLSPETEASVHGIVSRQLQHLTKLIGDLLDVARLTSGKIVLQSGPVDLLAIAERCLATIRGTGRADGLAFRVDGHPVVVDGDSVRLEQVLDNLIDNAVKYTPRGGRIDVSVEETGREAVLRVRDTGVGVAPELLPRMFDLFTQGPQGPERSQGGLGVGLAIVKRIVDLHRGTIHVANLGPGAGTEVVMRFPLAATAELSSPVPDAPVEITIRGRRILVVEDNADARETLRLLLQLDGHQVQLAEDGWSGLEITRRWHPEVALIDLGLPGLDGYEVARRMRAVPNGAGIRLIALTGYGQPQDRRRATEVGFDAYLVKPVDGDTLNRAIQVA